tara:strand:- start:979 stop:4233 length:3255 start_codon:yes stop_codon:yes gene_type:complete
MANTAAYNANEVAAVYMSLNRNDILSTAEGGSKLGEDETLKNGFYGLSDPLNLRGLLESFEVDFSQSSGKGSYKVRILNPTAELETVLTGFYSEVFPSNSSTFKNFQEDWELEERNLAQQRQEELGANDSPPMLPIIYLRFGYGTDEQSGLSRIHKARVFDIKYMVSDKKDKVIELHAVDLFSFSKQNPVFNKRPYMARTAVSDTATVEEGGGISLRKPSDILTQLFAGYLSTYPECIAAVDLGSYTDSINNLVYSVALGLAQGDVIAAKNKLLSDEGLEGGVSEEVGAQKLTPSQVKAFEKLLDRPLITLLDISREVDGKVTPQILYQAFKMVFEQIGLKWEMLPEGAPPPVTGPLSENQIEDLNTKTQQNIKDQNAAANKVNVKINTQTEWLQHPTEAEYTKVTSADPVYNGQHRLSFWPMAYDNGNIRLLTEAEKSFSVPVWVNAGMVNPENYSVGKDIDNLKEYKFSFPYVSLQTKFKLSDVTGETVAAPVPVCFPGLTPGNDASFKLTKPQFTPLYGNQDSVVSLARDLGQGNMPLLDISTGLLYPSAAVNNPDMPLPEGEFKVWAEYINSYGYGSNWDETLNPPLLNLEPTGDTVIWVLKNFQRYAENTQERQKQLDDEVEAARKEAEKNLTSEQVQERRAAEFAEELDKYSDGYVIMGDDGEQPHISAHLSTVMNNLNRLIVGKGSKLRLEQVQVNSLSVEDRQRLSEKCTLFGDVTWEEAWAKRNNCILLLMPGTDMTDQYGDQVIRPVLSFPQTHSIHSGPNYIWLDYGTSDSIIADLEFTGDNRVLLNLAQSNFSVRQWNDIKQLFDGTETLSENLVINSISKMLAQKIADLDFQGSTDSQSAQQDKLEEQLKLAESQSESQIDQELLDILPSLIASYQVNPKKGTDDLVELNVISANDAAQLRKLSSIISNPKHLDMLYPYADVDGKNNTLTSEVLMVSDNGLRKMPPTQTRILRRRIDMDSIRSRISLKEREEKMIDVAYNYSVAMQQESFSISITTLGIPEIDDPASEYLSRRVCFQFFDPRLANGQLHWLSGVYQITSFKHRINPTQGFLTELELIRLPNLSLSNMKDTR